MKIAHVLNHFLPDHIAGTEMYVYNLVSQLQEKGVEAVVIIPNYGINKNEEYFVGNVRVIKYAEPSVVDRSLIMSKREPEGLLHFKEILEEEKPDIVHFHEIAGANGITYRHVEVSKESGFKNIMTFHLSGYSCKTGNLMYKDEEICDGIIRIGRCSGCYYKVKMHNPMHNLVTFPLSMLLYSAGINSTKWNNSVGTGLGFPFIIKKLKDDLLKLADNCDALVSLTSWYKNILMSNGVQGEKIFHIAQGLTAQKTIEISAVPKNDAVLKMVFIGRISSFKGLHLLIAALQDIDPQKVILDIYGPDPKDEYAEGLKKISAAMANVNWKGTLVPGEVVAAISNYDLLCLPSAFSEMSPLVIQEAFAAKIPVLASDVYGNAEQVKDGVSGWLFKFKDVESLKDKLTILIEKPDLIKSAKENLPPVRSFEKVAEEYLQLYKDILIPAN